MIYQIIKNVSFEKRWLRQLMCSVVLVFTIRHARAFEVSENGKFSVITCTPGPDLYSLFGHTAIRYQDSIRGYWVDWVYNYGTFIFDDEFYVKFARGKLDYVLSKEDFPFFQEEYIYTGRGIFEQDLALSKDENQRLLNLLEENFLPENRTYRYDFFYDNCSTRVRDIIIRALSEQNDSALGFLHPDPDVIKSMSQVNFTYVYSQEHTFREAIQKYLDYQPWSDFGIDLALGMPCDRTIEKGQYMFLPDSLMQDFTYAIYHDKALVQPAEELLPQEYELTLDTVFTPMVVMVLFLFFHLVFGFFMRKKRLFVLTDRFLFFVTGLLGLFVIFLWFFTDHTATKWNLNLLWANPLNLFLAFLPISKWKGWVLLWIRLYFYLLIAFLLLWLVLPQQFNMAVIPIILALVFSCFKLTMPQFFLGLKAQAQ